METHNLDTASDYLNKLLLARGLLRNGKPIDFAEPTRASDGADGTMTRVINLIHDLIIRRDREAEQHENLASMIRNLRNTEAKQTVEIERLEAKVQEQGRSLALTEGQERVFKANLRNAEGTIRKLKEQVQRMKSTIQQIRAQYTTDIRKRDLEIQKLKTRVTERTRGKKDGPGVTTVTIIPPPKPTISRQKSSEGGEGVDTPGYSLKEETTEFLTQLCQNLSDENDALIRLVQDTIKTLKELQGLSEAGANDSTMGPDSLEPESDPLVGPMPPYETLSQEMSYVLDQLRALLTNPSFVSLEEVEIRDNEISRLRDGWEKMEARWKEAVGMMDNWHKRMACGGDGVNIDELKRGMKLGSSADHGVAHRVPDTHGSDGRGNSR
ncbi:NIMA interactive protein [Coccidioides immitis RS]|uniref:NIMA interactive protein n=1 Tax=Coccidioides immitis (strain RS) TaxID=246410 RepID=J3K458_COCIM|nr:NIMA interactive protein [Coccidioides immitis RS]EAS29059.3 NIMA interactive protein [Coccidioides immitis RS]